MSTHMKRDEIKSENRLLVKHATLSALTTNGDFLEFRWNVNSIPFAVRKLDISFCLSDDQKTDKVYQVRISGITDGHDLGAVYNNYSKTFTLYYDPPLQLQGSYLVEFLGYNGGNLTTFIVPHDGAMVLNLAAYNDY